jgi:hypothetical protein
MRKNYFSKLVKYIKNVYHIEQGLKKLSNGRVNPTYSTGQVILPVLFGFLLRIQSFNELNLMIKNNEYGGPHCQDKKSTCVKQCVLPSLDINY